MDASRFQDLLDTLLQKGIIEHLYPSATAAIGCKENTFSISCIGEAPLPGDHPVTEHTLYDMASLSKILGPSMIVLKSIETGRLQLTDTVGHFFSDAPADKKEITIQQLMTHTGGFEPDWRMDLVLTSPDQVTNEILTHPLLYAPGTKPEYSCMGYILLGKMLEKLYNKPLDQLADEMVFQPLHMDNTSYGPQIPEQCAATEIDAASGKPWLGIVHDENARFQGGISGNAGVFAPLTDIITFCKMLACGGSSYLSTQILTRAIQNETPGFDVHRGLGFHLCGTPRNFMSDDVPAGTFGHTGFTGTSFMIEPCSGFWVVLLTNRVYPNRDASTLYDFRRELHSRAWKLFNS